MIEYNKKALLILHLNDSNYGDTSRCLEKPIEIFRKNFNEVDIYNLIDPFSNPYFSFGHTVYSSSGEIAEPISKRLLSDYQQLYLTGGVFDDPWVIQERVNSCHLRLLEYLLISFGLTNSNSNLRIVIPPDLVYVRRGVLTIKLIDAKWFSMQQEDIEKFYSKYFLWMSHFTREVSNYDIRINGKVINKKDEGHPRNISLDILLANPL